MVLKSFESVNQLRCGTWWVGGRLEGPEEVDLVVGLGKEAIEKGGEDREAF